jgi:hypothetical protein
MLGSDSLLYVPPDQLATTTKIGLLQKLTGKTTDFLDGTNNFQSLANVPPPLQYDAIHNGIFRFNQRSPANTAYIPIPTGTASVKINDRWWFAKTGALVAQNTRLSGLAYQDPGGLYPQLNFGCRINTTTAMTAVAAADYAEFIQYVYFEVGQTMFTYPTSILVVARATVPGTFSVSLRNADASQSIVFPCTITAANTVQNFLIQNIPVMPYNQGNWNDSAGRAYTLTVATFTGSTYQTPNAGVWQSGLFIGHSSQSNFHGAVNNTFDLLDVRHVIGAKIFPFVPRDRDTDLGHCQRFFTKSYPLDTPIGNPISSYAMMMAVGSIPQATGGSLYGRVPFPRDMIKAPVMRAWHHSNSYAPDVVYIQGSTGAVTGQVASVGASANGLTALTVSSTNGAGGSPNQAYFDWTADAE